MIFTRSATDALKLVGETYRWGNASEFAYLRENHNSVLGIREFGLQKGGEFCALAEQDATPLMVFDEIDANVGGEIARAVGKKMAGLGARHQVEGGERGVGHGVLTGSR